jgi:hypothetical protein
LASNNGPGDKGLVKLVEVGSEHSHALIVVVSLVSQPMAAVSIVVSSYDGFSDCWAPFFHGINKYWKDCPYPVYLITNFKDFHAERCQPIKVGEDQGWSRNLLTVLERIPTPYVLYFQEDYWITQSVNTTKIGEYAALMEERRMDYLRLMAMPPPDHDFPHNPCLGLLDDGARWRNSLQAALWRTSVLQDLINPEESPWQFEIAGAVRSRKYRDTFLSVKNHGSDLQYYGIYYTQAVCQGRWTAVAKQYATDEGLDLDFSLRPSENWFHEFRHRNLWVEMSCQWSSRIWLNIRHPVRFWQKALARLGLSRSDVGNTKAAR